MIYVFLYINIWRPVLVHLVHSVNTVLKCLNDCLYLYSSLRQEIYNIFVLQCDNSFLKNLKDVTNTNFYQFFIYFSLFYVVENFCSFVTSFLK